MHVISVFITVWLQLICLFYLCTSIQKDDLGKKMFFGFAKG